MLGDQCWACRDSCHLLSICSVPHVSQAFVYTASLHLCKPLRGGSAFLTAQEDTERDRDTQREQVTHPPYHWLGEDLGFESGSAKLQSNALRLPCIWRWPQGPRVTKPSNGLLALLGGRLCLVARQATPAPAARGSSSWASIDTSGFHTTALHL